MQLIRDHLHHWDQGLACFVLPVDRLTLTKRRWRAKASDGTDFGFDLEHPLSDGDVFFQSDAAFYRVEQLTEPVLEVFLSSPVEAAQTGWKFGNLHFQIAVDAHRILAPDDPAIRQMLERERIAYQPANAVFRPVGGTHSHGHHPH